MTLRATIFWRKVDKDGPMILDTPCWQWTGHLQDGYGRHGHGPGTRQAHVIAYRELIGEPPPHLEPDHLCRNRACVNPAHIEWVTHRENGLRGESPWAENARKTHYPQGHEYDEENTRVNNAGSRVCITCSRGRALAYYYRTRSE